MKLCNLADQRNVIDLVGGNLVSRYLHLFEKIHGGKVKGRGEAF